MDKSYDTVHLPAVLAIFLCMMTRLACSAVLPLTNTFSISQDVEPGTMTGMRDQFKTLGGGLAEPDGSASHVQEASDV